MPNNNNRINFQVGYNVDQASVNAVKKSLQDLQHIKFSDFNGPKKDLDDIKQKASQVEAALTKAFNVNLNSLNTQAFNAELQKAGLNIDKIYTSFSKAGAQGQVAFSRMASEVLTTNMQLKLTNSLVSQMGETMANTVKWGIASSVMNNFTNSVRQAFDYVKALDSSLTDIRIVTKQSSELMANFAVQANNSAQALGRSTMDYTKAALTFYQQGLDEASVQARTLSVLKAQNITGAGLEMADYLTAVWNGYKVANEEAELYVDKLAAVADSSASNMSLLAIAMSKVASSANLLGVPVDSLNAQIATIVATTRQAPESVGNALKTIYSRINDIATGADDALISLGNYSAKMALVGISVLDANGRLRDTGDVIDEIGGKWETLSHEQQIYLARTMAGQRQYNNLLALFENWGKYSDLVNVSMEAQGATALKNAIYLESLGAKMEQLGAAGEKVKAALIDEEDLKGLVDFGTGAVNLFGNLILSIGGGKNALLTFGSIFTQVFSGTIAKLLNNVITHFQSVRNNTAKIQAEIQATQSFRTAQQNGDVNENAAVELLTRKTALAQKYYSVMSLGEINTHKALLAELDEAENTIMIWEGKKLAALNFAKTLLGSLNEAKLSLDAETGSYQKLQDKMTLLELVANRAKEAFSADKKEPGYMDELQLSAKELQIAVLSIDPSKALAIETALAEIYPTTEADSNLTYRLEAAMRNASNTIVNGIGNANEVVENYGKTVRKATSDSLQLQGTLDSRTKSFGQLFDISQVVKFTSGLGQLASVANNVVNIFRVWKNLNLSFGEKLLQTFTNLTMSAGMLVSGINNVREGWKSVSNLIIKAGNSILAARMGSASAASALAGAAGAAAAANTAEATSAGVATGANLGLAESFLTILAAAAPYIALVAAIVATTYALYKSYNKAALAAELAALKTKQAKLAYEKVNESYKNLKSSLDDLASKRDAFDGLTKGTLEWRNALLDVNDQVLSLIQEFPQLGLYVKTTSDGLLYITEKGQEAVKEETRRKSFASSYAYARANLESAKAQNYSLITDLSRDLDGLESNEKNGITPDLLLLLVSAINLHGLYILTNSEWLENNTSLEEDDIKVVQENIVLIKNLAKLVNANTTASLNLTNSIIQGLLVNSDYYKNSSNPLAYAKIVASLMRRLLEENKTKYGIVGSNNIDTPTLIKDFLQLYPNHEYANGLTYNKTGYLKYEDSEGNSKDVAIDEIISLINSYQLSLGSNAIEKAVYERMLKLSLAQSNILSLFSKGVNGVKLDWTKLSLDDIDLILNSLELMDIIAEMLGEDINILDVRSRVESSKDDIKNAITSYLKQLPLSVKGAVLAVVKDDTSVTQETAEALGSMLHNSYSKGLLEFLNTQEIIQGLSLLEILPFKEIVDSVSGTDITFNDFVSKLSLAGIVLDDVSNDAIQRFIDQIKAIELAITPELTYKTIHDIIDNLLDEDTISAEDAQKLTDLGLDLEPFFDHMADGSLILKASAKEFYDYANNQSLEGFKRNILSLKEEISTYSELNNSKYSYSNAENKDETFSQFSQSAGTSKIITSSPNDITGRKTRRKEDVIDTELFELQLNFLKAIGAQDDIITIILQKRRDNLKITVDDADALAKAVAAQRPAWEGVNGELELATDRAAILEELYNNAKQAVILVFEAKPVKTPLEIYNNIHDILGTKEDRKILFGALIDSLSYLKLKLAGLDVEDSFVKAANGMYVCIGALDKVYGEFDDLYDIANQISLQPLKDEIDSLKNTSYEDIIDTGYNFLGGHISVDYEGVQKQVNLLKEAGLITDARYESYQKLIDANDIQEEQLKEINRLLRENSDLGQKQLDKQLHDQQLSLAFSQLDLGDLFSTRNLGYFDTLSALLYAKAILAVSEALGLELENVKSLTLMFTELADSIDWVNDKLQDHVDDAALVAAVLEDLVSGIESIQKTWKDILKDGGLVTEQVIEETRQAVSDMFNQDVDSSFIRNHLEEIQRIAEGDITAVQELGNALAFLSMQQIEVPAHLTQELFNTEIQSLQSLISLTDWGEILVGTHIDEAPFYEALQRFITESGATEELINKILDGIGYTPNILYVDVPVDQFQKSENEGEYVYEGLLSDGQTFRSTISETFYNANNNGSTVKIPVIKGSKFAGGVTGLSNIGGSRITPSSSNRGGSKPSGGSKPKKPTIVKPQKLSEEKESIKDRSDVYHDINLELLKQEDILDDILKELKNLVNKDRLKNLEKQNVLLQKQKTLLDLKTGIAATELGRLKKELTDSLGNGIQFDPNGLIANYNEALDGARDNYNKAIDDYNKKVRQAELNYNKAIIDYNLLTAEQQEAQKRNLLHQKDVMDLIKKSAQDDLDTEKEKYDAIKNNIKEYDDTLKLQRDIANQQQLIQEKIYENLIAKSKIRVDLSIDTGKLERDWLDFENKFIKKLDKDDFLGNAKANLKELMSYFDSLQIQLTANQIKDIKKEITIMLAGGTSDIYGTNLAQAKEDLEKYMKQQMDDLENIQDVVDDIKDNYLDALDDAKDKMDDQIDQYERVNDLVEHNMKLTLMLYGDKAYDTMEKYYDYQKDNNQNILNNLRAEQLYWQTLLNQLTRGSDAWKQIKENLDKTTDDLNSKLLDMIDNLATQFENKINGIIDRLNNALTAGRGLDFLDEQWDYISNYDDNFLDTFETKTGIDEVERLYKSLIDSLAGSPKSQQKLNKLMNDQLKLLREKDHLTEYDLERAKASLEVEKARLALEEARDRKTTMRLRRDSQGNYTYQYVADELKLGDLQAALADAQANLYNTDKLHYKQNLNTLYDTYKDYIEKMKDLTTEYNATQDEEERKRIQGRIDLLKEATAKMMDGLTLDNQQLLLYLRLSFFGGIGTDTSALTIEEQMEIMKLNIPYMLSNIQDLSDTIVGEGGILPATADMVKLLNDATVLYDKNVEQILASAGTNLLTISNVTDALGNSLDKNILQVLSLTGYYTDLIDKSVEAINEIQKVLSTTLGKLNELIPQLTINNLAEAYNLAQLLNGVGTQINGLYLDKDKNTLLTQKNGVFTDDQLVEWNLNTNMTNQLYQDYLKKMSNTDSLSVSSKVLDTISNLDIGKLQLQDLKTVVNTIQAITSNINSIAGQGIDSIMSNASGYIGNINNVEQLDQNVHIEANFPNVTQHTLIEQAFENLVNMASMRASRYKD